jgi:hypothetical protein
MGSNRNALRTVVVLLAIHADAFAYKETTHADIARYAMQRSELGEPSNEVLSAFGLKGSVVDQRFLAPGIGGIPVPMSVQDLVMRGAIEEDHGKRSLRHFFDPQRDGTGFLAFEPSPVWALQSESAQQEYALDDARRYLLGALTAETELQRTMDLTRTFRALGHVIHHIQDMHQPQHVRGDIHCDDTPLMLWFVPLPNGCATSAELKNDVYRPSAYEQYVWEQGVVEMDGYPTPDYATFSTADKFWESGWRGGAEFTSRNFVSVGTNFTLDTSQNPPVINSDTDHPLPVGAEATMLSVDINSVAFRRRVTDPLPMAGDITFVETPTRDYYASGFNVANPAAGTLSILYHSIQLDTGDVYFTHAPVFTLNSINYQFAADRLLPRAAAYSAGLINYFFRGRIGIELPEEGVYGIIDHATTNAAGQGFGKLKLRLRNASPDGVKPSGERVPQTMQGGTLVAVAKYTLNGCYQPDLTGDFAVAIATGEVFNPAGCSIDQYFAGEEQISQSAAILAVTLTPAASEFVFDFSAQPIPINARDLRIQVVYTGQLGAEADGIAFGGRDISEPTHLVIYNNSDYYLVDGTFYTPEQIRASATLSNRTAGLNIDPSALNGVTLSVVAGKPVTDPSGAVGVNGYVRVAVLADIDAPFSLGVKASFQSGGTANATFNGIWANTTDLRGEPAYITPFGIYRGTRVHFVDVVFKANSAAPIADGELVTMSGRAVPDPGPTPIPVRY